MQQPQMTPAQINKEAAMRVKSVSLSLAASVLHGTGKSADELIAFAKELSAYINE